MKNFFVSMLGSFVALAASGGHTIGGVASPNGGGTSTNLILLAFGVVGGGSGLVALVLLPKRGRAIAVEASENAVNTLNTTMQRLESELKRTQRDLERTLGQLDEIRVRRQEDAESAAAERSRLLDRIASLRERIVELETKLGESKHEVDTQAYRGKERRKQDVPHEGPERRSGNLPLVSTAAFTRRVFGWPMNMQLHRL